MREGEQLVRVATRYLDRVTAVSGARLAPGDERKEGSRTDLDDLGRAVSVGRAAGDAERAQLDVELEDLTLQPRERHRFARKDVPPAFHVHKSRPRGARHPCSSTCPRTQRPEPDPRA